MAKADTPARRILVVDDEPMVRDSVTMLLQFDGHKVETAANGKEALSLFENGKFDLVITDYEMAVMRGDELAAAIKAHTPNQPVIMITAFAEMLQSSGKHFANVDCVISKPFHVEDLREAIARVLSKA